MKQGKATEPAPASVYDEGYENPTSKYRKAPEDAPWVHLWRWALEQVPPGEAVLELGCGPGHFAQLLLTRDGPTNPYYGVDFSLVAVRQARRGLRGIEADVNSIRHRDIEDALDVVGRQQEKPAVVVCLEVLEHLAPELEQRILGLPARWNCRLVATVPQRDSRTHMRYFPTREEATAHYGATVHALPGHWGFVLPDDALGGRMTIHPTALVGLPPCIYGRGPNGTRPSKLAPNHGVEIGDDVDILALAAVVNGTERPTRIGRGSRLLHRAHVGHDCIIGEDVIIGAGSLVAGFAEVGDRTELKIGALVRNRVRVGSDCIIGMGAVVVKDVPDNSVVYGSPGRVVRRNRDDLPWEGPE